MKNTIRCLFACACFMILSGSLHAQLQNGDFENWTADSYVYPSQWPDNSNSLFYELFGLQSLYQETSTPSGANAVRIETRISGGDTALGYIKKGTINFNNLMDVQGGIPYTGQPNQLEGYFNVSVKGNDRSMIGVGFKRNGSVIGGDTFKLDQSYNTTGFEYMTFNISDAPAIQPDTIAFAIISSDPTSANITHGSSIAFDSIVLTGNSTTQQLPGNGFENWKSTTEYRLDKWNGNTYQVSRSTDAHTGSYALKDSTRQLFFGTVTGFFTSGRLDNNDTLVGGHYYNRKKDTLVGYYKYIPQNQDSAFIRLTFSDDQGDTISSSTGSTKWFSDTVSSYTKFEIPFNLNREPDTVRIDINSSHMNADGSNIGSVLKLDNLKFKHSQPTGLFSNHSRTSAVTLYPNPAGEVLHLESERKINKVTVLSVSGKVLISEADGASSSVDVSSLNSGSYLCRVQFEDGTQVTRRFSVK